MFEMFRKFVGENVQPLCRNLKVKHLNKNRIEIEFELDFSKIHKNRKVVIESIYYSVITSRMIGYVKSRNHYLYNVGIDDLVNIFNDKFVGQSEKHVSNSKFVTYDGNIKLTTFTTYEFKVTYRLGEKIKKSENNKVKFYEKKEFDILDIECDFPYFFKCGVNEYERVFFFIDYENTMNNECDKNDNIIKRLNAKDRSYVIMNV